jgi:hypothetical protein
VERAGEPAQRRRQHIRIAGLKADDSGARDLRKLSQIRLGEGGAQPQLAQADQTRHMWKRHFDRVTRQVCFDIPSSRPGRNYRTTADGCTCSDLKYRPWTICKHMLAVRLQLELDKEQEYAF